jgi:[ribosomal protein S18]-alanine N-acetyltransferase
MNNTKQSQSKTACHIRWMIRRDLPDCVAINNASFANQHLQWLADDFIAHMKERDTISMVVELKTRIVGYVVYRICNQSIWVMSLAVHPEHRHQGIGRMMIEKLKWKLDYHRRKELVIEIEETNLEAQLFFRSHGFKWFYTVRRSYGENSFYQLRYRVGKDSQ